MWNSIILLFSTFFFVNKRAYAAVHSMVLKKNFFDDNSLSIPVQLLIFTAFLTFIPALLLTMTSFTRIVIVFSFLRNALGTPYAPPNQIIIGLSLFLTFFIMYPVAEKSYQKGYIPYVENKISLIKAIDDGFVPFKDFMLSQTRKNDIQLFLHLKNRPINEINKRNFPIEILIPAFIISELKTAFEIGFIIFIPFLILDLVISSLLMSLGMVMVPPSAISLPFKLILFVLIDGWNLLIGSLFKSFYM